MTRRHHRRNKPPLPLDTAQECFTWLVTGPYPLSIDGRDFAGLPNRAISLDEVREQMLQRRYPRRTRDAIWVHLVQHSRDEGASWTLACVGMALPALASICRWLAARYPGDTFDVHAEVLAGFLAALARIDLRRPKVLGRLRWAAYRAGYTALDEALNAPTPRGHGFASSPPRPPWGHPDLVLARAVRQSVLTRTEADLIGATRLDDMTLADWATAHGTATGAAYKMRRRAERRLVAFVRDQVRESDPDDPVAARVLADAPVPPAQPRTPSSSRSVVEGEMGGREGAAEKVPGSVSKTRPKSGLLGCGGTPPTAPSTPSGEEPQCA